MPQLTLVIGNKNYSSWSLRVWLAMRVHGIEFREHRIDLGSDEAMSQKLEHAPSGRVPILHADELTIWDSLAICEYLAEAYPEHQLWPTDPKARARARALCAEIHSGVPALRTRLPMNCRARKERRDRGDAVRADVARVLACWRDTRKEFGHGGPFLFGEFSIADAYFAPIASRFFTYDVELGPTAQAYQETLFALPELQRWMADAEREEHRIPQFDAAQ